MRAVQAQHSMVLLGLDLGWHCQDVDVDPCRAKGLQYRGYRLQPVMPDPLLFAIICRNDGRVVHVAPRSGQVS